MHRAYDLAREEAAKVAEERAAALRNLEHEIGWAQAKNWADSFDKCAEQIRALPPSLKGRSES